MTAPVAHILSTLAPQPAPAQVPALATIDRELLRLDREIARCVREQDSEERHFRACREHWTGYRECLVAMGDVIAERDLLRQIASVIRSDLTPLLALSNALPADKRVQLRQAIQRLEQRDRAQRDPHNPERTAAEASP